MLTIIIADAELETIPEKMQHDRAIRNLAKERRKDISELLLDSNYMHTSIDRYYPGESRRRGRPDIIYILLQVAMESILNKNEGLRIYIHTRNDFVIEVAPYVRLPKSYNRFVGLIEKLFASGEISDAGKSLLKLERRTISELVGKKGTGKLVIFSPAGKEARLGDLIRDDSDCTVIIGGFSEGDFISDVYSLADSYSIFKEELTIWTVAFEVISQYERSAGLV